MIGTTAAVSDQWNVPVPEPVFGEKRARSGWS